MAFVDPYFDKNIGTLRNLLNAQSLRELERIEPQIVFANELELEAINIPRTNDLGELLLIHRQLFKGVYDWAGEIRTVDIKKNEPTAAYFLIVTKIVDAARYVFGELSNEDSLKGLSLESFVARLSYYYDQLNFIHPFREGNGRAQRVFWRRVARDANYKIEWDRVLDNENDEASKAAVELSDLSGLQQMFTRIVRPI